MIKSNVETLAYIDSKKNFFFGEKGKLNTYCEDLNSSKLFDLEYISPFFNSMNESIYICYEFKIEDFSSKIIKYNILLKQKEKTIINDSKLKILFSNNKYLVLFESGDENFNSITFYNHLTETTLWQYAITGLGAEKVSKILGVFGQTLVVVCGYSRFVEIPNGNKVNAKLEKIIGLYVNTGHLLFETDQYEINGETHFLGSGLNTNWVFNDGETFVHAILDDYLSFDTQTGKITALNIREMAQEKGINGLQSSSIEGNKIGFRAFDDQLGGFQSVIGIFNTQSLKIEDHYTYADARKEGAYFKPGQPIVSGNKIYALDSKNTLHIYERE
ncbi:MAG: hypothetical protein IPO04_09555 [Cytophagaceae bacterium]|nr:hypothetical protein [Cytophagaceae bacterium]